MKTTAMTFGARVRQLREQAGLSAYALAAAAGLAPINLTRIERSDHAPSWAAARRLATALGVTLADLDFPADLTK